MLIFAVLAKSILINIHEEKSFLSWMRETNNFFVGDEYHFRLGIYLSAKRFVEEHNRHSSFKLGLNNLAHLTHTEYQQRLGVNNHKIETEKADEKIKTTISAPDSFDWREKGVCNIVKDQGQCGSCWAFSTIQAQESQWAIKHNQLFSLSEQHLIDCVKDCSGCLGGYPGRAMTWVKYLEHGMFMLESDYPYKAVEGKCQFDKNKGVTKIKTHKSGTRDEEVLKSEVAANGVYSICIDANSYEFHLYQSGIYTTNNCQQSYSNHAVGLVGYGTENGVDYWIVRNSWSSSWGENGYIRMRRNYRNMCGIATEAIIPVVD